MNWPLFTIAIASENDVVRVRQRARHIAELLGLGTQVQTRLATAVSEIARNAYSYGGGGKAEFLLEDGKPQQTLWIRIADRGRGIADLPAILEGRYESQHGMGVGLIGARRLVDRFAIESAPGSGTTVDLGQYLPREQAVARRDLTALAARLQDGDRGDSLSEVKAQNHELLLSLQELRSRQLEIEELNRELADTNRGVVALHAELEARADELRQASETKSRFLSNLSHEFRTPLNSIMALSRLLLDRVDGDLAPEQSRQVSYIMRSGETLLDMVNDLLDLAKVEAGRVELRPTLFSVEDLFGALRGVLKPLRTNPAVELAFEVDPSLPQLHCDEGKLAQILRNLVSNALKFTPEGLVKVTATPTDDGRSVIFAVSDSGIGIAPEDQGRIFEEFTQVDNPLQSRYHGTGLGLPLSRRLAELLGGTLVVESAPGKGSTFRLYLPLVPAPEEVAEPRDGGRILLIDDDATFRYVLRQLLQNSGAFEILEAGDGVEGLERVADWKPDIVILDLQMPRRDGFATLAALAALPGKQPLTIVMTSMSLDRALLARLPSGTAVFSKQSIAEDGVSRLLREIAGMQG